MSFSHGDQPMYSNGVASGVCRPCRLVTMLPQCPSCGGAVELTAVFNSMATGEDGPASRWGLTPREAQLVALLTDGLSNYELAQLLGLSEKTVKELLSRARIKMGGGNRVLMARLWWDASRDTAGVQ